MKKPPGFRRRNKIPAQFAWRLIEMLESPAYRVLSVSAHRVLDRIEIELGHHGGNDNGALPVTFRNFEDYGIDRHAIAPAMREAEALGFIRVRHGRGGNAEYRDSNKFALTYRPVQLANQTNDWKKIETMEQAREIAHVARDYEDRNISRWGFLPISVWETPTENQIPQWGKPPLQGHRRNPHYYLYLGEGMRHLTSRTGRRRGDSADGGGDDNHGRPAEKNP